MSVLLGRVPWFLSSPFFALLAVGLGWGGYQYAGDYFDQTCATEVNLLTGEASRGCGAGGGGPLPAGASASTPLPTGDGVTTLGPTGNPGPQTQLPADTVAPAPASGVLLRAAFRDGAPGHNGSGAVELQRLPDGTLNVFFSDFSVTSGPDLFVILSTGDGGYRSEGAVNLGRLKANNGSQNYTIPEGADLSRYRSVVIWCRQFDVTFAVASFAVAP